MRLHTNTEIAMNAATLIASNQKTNVNSVQSGAQDVAGKPGEGTGATSPKYCSGEGVGGFDVSPAELGQIANKVQREIAALDRALEQIKASESFPAFLKAAEELNPYPSWIRRIPMVPPAYMVEIARTYNRDSVLCIGRDGLELSVDMGGICSGAYEKKPATGEALRRYGWTPEKLESGYRAAQKMLAAALGEPSDVWTHHHGNPNREFIR